MFIISTLLRGNTSREIPSDAILTDPNFHHAKLAACCCVALGKAHCATIHTLEGHDPLPSSYAFGSIPVTRQVAQMLFDVPHHMAASIQEGENTEKFRLSADLTLIQAENYAASISDLAEGKVALLPDVL